MCKKKEADGWTAGHTVIKTLENEVYAQFIKYRNRGYEGLERSAEKILEMLHDDDGLVKTPESLNADKLWETVKALWNDNLKTLNNESIDGEARRDLSWDILKIMEYAGAFRSWAKNGDASFAGYKAGAA